MSCFLDLGNEKKNNKNYKQHFHPNDHLLIKANKIILHIFKLVQTTYFLTNEVGLSNIQNTLYLLNRYKYLIKINNVHFPSTVFVIFLNFDIVLNLEKSHKNNRVFAFCPLYPNSPNCLNFTPIALLLCVF